MACKAPRHVAAPSLGGGSTILLAEDDVDLRERLAAALQHDGHRVVRVSTGLGLIDAVHRILYQGAERGVINLMISAAIMPGLSGVAALFMLRDAELRIPVILLAKQGENDEITTAVRRDAVVLMKPIDLPALLDAARTALTP